MKTLLCFLISALCFSASAAVQTKGTASAVQISTAEQRWQRMTEEQRIKANLWSRADRLSVPRELWGTWDYTIKVQKTFGEKLVPKPSTLDNVHCHRVVDRQGNPVSVARALKMKPLPPRK